MPRIQLTNREDEVLRLTLAGLSNEEIAARLEISRRTVETHMRTLFRKAGVTRRAQLTALYSGGGIHAGLSSPEQVDGTGDRRLLASHRRLDREDCGQELHRYASAVRGLVDRQFPLFEERVEITLTVGEQDGQDFVVERRWTRPQPYLVYRILAPIVNWPGSSQFEVDDLDLACHVNGHDTQVDIHPVRDVTSRQLVMILFRPGLREETEWVLRYRSPQLWSPLRDSGQDSLTWSTSTLDRRHPATTSELTLKVIYPGSWSEGRLAERSDLGETCAERLPSGQTQLTWYDLSPGAVEYRWLLQASPRR